MSGFQSLLVIENLTPYITTSANIFIISQIRTPKRIIINDAPNMDVKIDKKTLFSLTLLTKLVLQYTLS